MIVAGHAATGFGGTNAPPPPTPTAKPKPASPRATSSSNENNRRQTPPQNSAAPADTTPVVVANTALVGEPRVTTSRVAPPPPPPLGNLAIITYLNDPAKPGFKNERIGGVKVEVKRTVGNNYCGNRKNNPRAVTNQTAYRGKELVHGTANFLDCNTGTYTVKLLGRKGYAPIKGTHLVKTTEVNKDSTTTVTFIMNKKEVKDRVSPKIKRN